MPPPVGHRNAQHLGRSRDRQVARKYCPPMSREFQPIIHTSARLSEKCRTSWPPGGRGRGASGRSGRCGNVDLHPQRPASRRQRPSTAETAGRTGGSDHPSGSDDPLIHSAPTPPATVTAARWAVKCGLTRLFAAYCSAVRGMKHKCNNCCHQSRYPSGQRPRHAQGRPTADHVRHKTKLSLP
jgi:hypothetical protein